MGTTEECKKEAKDLRITWRNKFEFAFNVVGFNVGLGNIWRFSYLCFKDGGGAFLIPYVLSAVLIGIPLLFLEVAVGQYTRRGCIAAYDILPLMRGIGYSGVVISFLANVFFVVVMAWCVFYFFNSLTVGELAWGTCDNWWNSENCVPIGSVITRMNNSTFANSSLNSTNTNVTGLKTAIIAAPVEFFNNYVLQRSSGIDEVGGFSNWKMIGCFIACWVICYLCICRGIRTTGKVAYVTVTAPYILILALFIRGVTLEGADEGIRYYITPNMTRLREPAVWLDAGSQVVYSLSICSGAFYGMGSYNKFSFDCYKSAYLFVGTCCCSSLFFGFVVFSFIGHMAFTQGLNVTDIADGGPGLVFVVFPDAFSTLPAPQVWAAAFFLGLSFLAVDSAFTLVEGSITALADYYPKYFGNKGTHLWRAGICVVFVIVSLPQFADNGIYVFEIINQFGASGMAMLWVVLFESIAIGWIYGIDRFWDNVKEMIGYYPSNLVKYCLKYVTPAFCMAIFIALCAEYQPLSIGNYVYPWWGNVLGWFLQLMSMLCIPIVAIYTVYKSPGTTIRKKWEYATTSRIETRSSGTEDDLDMKEKMIMA